MREECGLRVFENRVLRRIFVPNRNGGGESGANRVLVEKLEGRRPLERPRHRWEDDTKMDIQEVRGGVHREDWFDSG